jgi:hypothetical protein
MIAAAAVELNLAVAGRTPDARVELTGDVT